MYQPRSLAAMLDPIAKQAIGKDWGLYAALLDHWQEIVGKDYADVSSPAKVSFPHQPQEARRKGGTLTIRIPKGLALEFTYKAETIKQRVNGFFGYEVFSRIALDNAPLAPRKAPSRAALTTDTKEQISRATEAIDDPELRQVLESLGQSVFSSERAPKY